MISITYGTTEEIYSLNGASRTSYGIAAYSNAEVDGTATIIASLMDITSDREKVDKLVALCNQMELSVIHLYDVVEDILDD